MEEFNKHILWLQEKNREVYDRFMRAIENSYYPMNRMAREIGISLFTLKRFYNAQRVMAVTLGKIDRWCALIEAKRGLYNDGMEKAKEELSKKIYKEELAKKIYLDILNSDVTPPRKKYTKKVKTGV